LKIQLKLYDTWLIPVMKDDVDVHILLSIMCMRAHEYTNKGDCMNKEIYYFTGTGNTLQISKEVAKNLGDTSLISISSLLNQNIVETDADIIGIIFPVYFLNEPKIVEDFFSKLRTKEGSYIFVICNCGAQYEGTLKISVDKLAKSNNKVSSTFNVFMPDNSIAFPTPKEKHEPMIKEMIARCKEIAKLINKREVVESKGNKAASLFGRTVMKGICKRILGFDSMKLNESKCINCSICEKVCPINNITNNGDKPCWGDNCHMCFACIHYCPQKAVTYKRQNPNKDYQYVNPNIDIKEIIGR